MRNVDGHLGTATNAGAFDAMRAAARPVSWSMTAVAEPQKFSDFEALLLAIAGHDLPQPLQAIQSAQELLGNGVRTRSGLHHLASNQIAINRLTEQLDQLIAALRLREHAGDIELSAICLEPLLGQAGRENEAAALRKGIEIRTVSTSASIMSDPCFSAPCSATWSATPSIYQTRRSHCRGLPPCWSRRPHRRPR